MGKLNITKGKIGNALESTAMNHVVAVANDIYDEDLEKYQKELNAQIGKQVLVKICATLPTIPSSGDENKIHLIKKSDEEVTENSSYKEYVFNTATGKWELLGDSGLSVTYDSKNFQLTFK